MKARRVTEQSFWQQVNVGAPAECWPHKRPQCNGYGVARWGGKQQNAHRIGHPDYFTSQIGPQVRTPINVKGQGAFQRECRE